MKIRIILILTLILMVMGAILSALYLRFQTLQEQYSNAMNNYKAYDELLARRLDSANARNYELKLTKEQLEYSHDSVIQKLNEVRKELKIKQKNIERLEYIYENTVRHDSIFLFDTILRDGVSIDTTLVDEWRRLNLKLSYPNKIDIETEFRNELSVVVSSEKQTIKPSSKIFFIRWFQRKQKVILVNAIEKNPYSTIKEQRFIEIIK